ncbi:MAG: DNA mismatch repair endonuclease MutL [Clostridia bacterium]|nr:DNA mismatch repair endonuclease MutL [Clostridia bacterium]
MEIIRVLDTHTANRIAAGEVVDRPASIVKELVENAIDAGASHIVIEANGGGIDLIRIRDDGCGMSEKDAVTAFARHATSKIHTASDLEDIGTLGFRGEALASIAAVSRVTLRTKMQDAENGVCVRIHGGEIVENAPTGCADGTLFLVENVFYNTPARLKFLKSARTEAAMISDYVSRMMMAYPQIAFKLVQNDRTIYQSAGDGDLLQVLGCVYGKDTLPHLKPLSFDDGYIRLQGYAGTAQAAKNNRLAQSFFINHRYIKSQKLSFTVQRAYDTRLMSGRFPLIVMDMCISGREIDVNVHPNKLDVRFKQEDRVMHAAYAAVRAALGTAEIPAMLKQDVMPTPREIWFGHSAENKVGVSQEAGIEAEARPSAASYMLQAQQPQPGAAYVREPAVQASTAVDDSRYSAHAAPDIPVFTILPSRAAASPMPQPDSAPAAPNPVQTEFTTAPYQVIGQLFNCYLIIQQGEAAFFIDQHAAHERKLYEQMMQKGLHADAQILLTPHIETLSAAEYAILPAHIEDFRALGFDIEDFGSMSVSIRAVPHIFGKPQAVSFLHDALDMLERKEKLSTAELKRSAIIQQACKHAIKAGAILDEMQIRELLDDFQANGVPLTCPHGRPVMMQMQKSEFEKLFKRLV